MADATVTVEDLLREGAVVLRQAGVANPRLDCRILLGHVLGRDPGGLLPGDDTPVAFGLSDRFRTMLARRRDGEPVGRILLRREFFGLDFHLSDATLEPRPDSEVVVELALDHLAEDAQILDLGTGTGCLLLSLLTARPDCAGLGVDCSEGAVKVAAENAARLGLSERAAFRQSQWFGSVSGRFDLIISNPPYIPSAHIGGLMAEVRDHDPMAALDGGPDGLCAYRAILAEAASHLTPAGVLVFEIGAGQMLDVVTLAQSAGLRLLDQRNDLGGHVRALAFTASS